MNNILFERERETKIKALKLILILLISIMMAIPLVQHLQNEYASTPVESYSYYNEMVRFVGQNAFIGFGYNIYPVSWTLLRENQIPSKNGVVNPFTAPLNTSAPLIKQTFTHYYVKRISTGLQNSAIMVEWNSNLRIAEIFTFLNNSIDASISIKNIGVSSVYMSAFSISTRHHVHASVNGLSPESVNSSNGNILIPGNDNQVFIGHISINWGSESSIFNIGAIQNSGAGDILTLPFNIGVLSPNETYTIDPIIRSGPVSPIVRIPSPPPPATSHVVFTENGLPSGDKWSVAYDGKFYSSSSATLTISSSAGTNGFSVGTVSGQGQIAEYKPSPATGSVGVSSYSTSYVSVNYRAIKAETYTQTFTESGLPAGTEWTVAINGQTYSSSSSSISFNLYNGTHSYSISSPYGYSTVQSSGSINVNGAAKTIEVNFHALYPVQLTDLNITYCEIGASIVGQHDYSNLSYLIQKHTSTQSGASSWGIVCGGIYNFTVAVNYHNSSGPGVYYIPYNIGGYTVNVPVYYGNMQIWALNSVSGLRQLIAYKAVPKGNGTFTYTFQITPGVYGGFYVCLNNKTSNSEVNQVGQFDVKTTFMNEPPCLPPNANSIARYLFYECGIAAASSSEVYNSTGSTIGYLTESVQGLNINYTKGQTRCINYDFGFYSSQNNGLNGHRKYGIFSYNQAVVFNGNQDPTAFTSRNPYIINNYGGTATQGDSNSGATNVSEALYLGITAALSIFPITAVAGVMLSAMYPFVFNGQFNSPIYNSKPNNFYCNQSAEITQVLVPTYSCGDGPAWSQLPFWKVISTSNDNVSLIQDAKVYTELHLQPNSFSSWMTDLNFLTYSVNARIVPIDLNPPCNNEYDLVNCTGGGYSGPSYSAAVSEPIYMGQVG